MVNRLEENDEEKPREDISKEELHEKMIEILKSIPKEDVVALAGALGFDKVQKESNILYDIIMQSILEKKIGKTATLMATSRVICLVLRYTHESEGKKGFDSQLACLVRFLNEALKIKLEIRKEGAE